ncbi:MAG: hypothetical protein QG612_808 [Pseudomonadota bacterium]|nr:hypothetical protein [Pseudomonadota bacterium]
MLHSTFIASKFSFDRTPAALAALGLCGALLALSATAAQAQTPSGSRKAWSTRTATTTTTTTTTGTTTTGTGTTTGTTGTTTTTTTTATTTPSAVATAALGLTPCVPSGKGTDYPVGPGLAYTSLDQVPWESLKAGDTVRIHPSSTPYRGKFALIAQGTADAPVRICGVRASDGSRPVIDASGATTRAALSDIYGSSTYVRDIHQDRTLIVIKPSPAQGWTAYPRHIRIDGLKLTGAHPDRTFRNAAGAVRSYLPFGACVWIERGQDISIIDNEITDCQMGVFSKSTDDGDFAVTRNLRIAGNTFSGHGIVGDVHQHSTYTQGINVLIEFNRYGPLRAGALGNGVKDRSAGTVVRYNRIEEGSHAIDLVESEDFPLTAMATPAYRSTYVYGNQIVKTGDTGAVISYGGDHFGSQAGALWGEPIFRKGTLHFFHNTLQLKGTAAWVFRIATTEEKVEAWGNAIHFASTISQKSMRMDREVAAAWTGGGIVNLGRNWISSGWQDSDIWHPVRGQLNVLVPQLGDATLPFDTTAFRPVAGSTLIDTVLRSSATPASVVVTHQLDASGQPQLRTRTGSADDLGAVER